jgi:4-hydroxy-4-methyl-2-oxoglutarate aldolase
MAANLTKEDLEALRKWPTCAISNGIELFNFQPRNEGFMLPEIKCQVPDSGRRRVPPQEWWELIQKTPGPRIVVHHDVDRPVIGSFWGEVNGNIHKALGCAGVVTDGSVRDLDEVKEIGFQFYSSCVTVSHAYVHLVEIGAPVKVGGLWVKTGDLLMGDKHGVIKIPLEIAKDIPKACQAMEDWERKVINFCKSKEFNVEGLKQRFLGPRPTWPPK